MRITFKGNTQDEIRSQIVDAGLNTPTPCKRFVLPWEHQPVPKNMTDFIRNGRIPAIKKVRDDLGLGLKEAKDLVDYIVCCLDM